MKKTDDEVCAELKALALEHSPGLMDQKESRVRRATPEESAAFHAEMADLFFIPVETQPISINKPRVIEAGPFYYDHNFGTITGRFESAKPKQSQLPKKEKG